MKNFTTALVASALIFGSSFAMSEEEPEMEISANVALANNYLFYGASQTADNGAGSGGEAISGGFDLALPFEILGGQWYVGTWASNVEWGTSDTASIELDFYGGIAGDSIGSTGVSWDVGAWAYTYPDNHDSGGTEDFDYIEYYVNLGYTFDSVPLSPSLSVGVYFSDEYFGTTDQSFHVPVGLEFSLPYDLTAYGSYGYFTIDNTAAIDDYSYYSFGIAKTVLGVDLDLSWTGATDDCRAVQGTNCGGTVFSIAKSF